MKARLIGEFGSNLFAEAQKELIAMLRVAGASGTPRKIWQVRRQDRKMFTGLRRQATTAQSKDVFFSPHRKVKNGVQVYVLEDNVQPIPEKNVFFAKIQVIGNPEIQGYLKRTYLHPVE